MHKGHLLASDITYHDPRDAQQVAWSHRVIYGQSVVIAWS